MSRQWSKRVFAAVAIVAAVVMIVLPLAGFLAMPGPPSEPRMSAMADCETCPGAAMAMVNCAQAYCGLPAMEAGSPAAVASARPRYTPVRMSIPPGQHMIPPVSPG